MDAAIDRRDAQFQAKPINEELPHLGPREPEALGESGNERRQHRADQTALAQHQIPPAYRTRRALPLGRTLDRLVPADANRGKIAVLQARDPQHQIAALQVINAVSAIHPPARRHTERQVANRATNRIMVDLTAHQYRLRAPVAAHPATLARSLHRRLGRRWGWSRRRARGAGLGAVTLE